MAMTDYDPTKGQPLANLGRVIAEPPTPPSLFREACERIADMLKQDDGEAFFEAEKFLKRHAPDLYNTIGVADDKQGELGLGNAELDGTAPNHFDPSKRGFSPK